MFLEKRFINMKSEDDIIKFLREGGYFQREWVL